jgi:hypothetical protein
MLALATSSRVWHETSHSNESTHYSNQFNDSFKV